MAFDKGQTRCLSKNPEYREPHWQHDSFRHHTLSSTLTDWLLDTSSLTQKLSQKAQGQLQVEVLQQRIQRPRRSEYQALALNRHHWAVVREVILYGNDKPWVYARTVIPLSTLTGPLRRLHHLGNRPLGEELFADPSMRRQGLEVAAISPPYLPQHARLEAVSLPAWGRRSVFFLKNKPLLVAEVFLEDLLLS